MIWDTETIQKWRNLCGRILIQELLENKIRVKFANGVIFEFEYPDNGVPLDPNNEYSDLGES